MDTNLTVRLDRAVKVEVEAILTAANTTSGQVVRGLYNHILRTRRLPFDPFDTVDEETLAAARKHLEERDQRYEYRRTRSAPEQ